MIAQTLRLRQITVDNHICEMDMQMSLGSS